MKEGRALIVPPNTMPYSEDSFDVNLIAQQALDNILDPSEEDDDSDEYDD